ncbi:MAG: pyridoxal-dependent decarboxylase [Bacteroidales bacterium]
MEPADFRKYGHEFIDWLADYFENIEDYPVKPDVQPGDILSLLPKTPPQQGEPMEDIFRDFKKDIMPGMTHWQHPGWFAFFPANNSPESVLAELLTAGLGAQCMIWQTSPAAAELEQQVMEWLRQMLQLPDSFTGVIQDTASSATLAALLSAREARSDYQINKKGFTGKLAVYSTAETHSSIEKGVKIAGYGKEQLRTIPTGNDFAMLPDKLEEAILVDIRQGITPTCVVASLGTTSSMAMDPVAAIAEICRKYDVWLHVDAAMAGTAAMVPELAGFFKGTEQADSFVFNPHKWMMVNFDCSAYFVKDVGKLVRTFEINPEYLKSATDNQVNNYRDWGVQLGRRFRALKLWFVLRSYGVEGIRQMVRRHVALARSFEQWVNEDPRFELLAPVNLSLVCFRYNPGGMDEEALAALNRKVLDQVNLSGKVYLTHTSLKGRYAIRLSVGQRTTTQKQVQLAWDLLREAAEKM